MAAEVMDLKYIRIAEITEQIEKINQMIVLHEQTTGNQSMIKQYVFKRGELIMELQEIFKTFNLIVQQAA